MSEINLTINLTGDWSGDESIRLKTAFDYAMQNTSKLPENILTMEGMSGHRYRRLINKYVELTADSRYLEIGSWSGSTACSAMYGNKCKMLCIDNWSTNGSPKDTFFQNINTYKNDNVDFNFIEKNFEDIDYAQIGKFNTYLFDGPHEENNQYAGIANVQMALDDTYLLVVDDWNWPGPRNGTWRALDDLGHKIISSITIHTTQDDTHPDVYWQNSEWHNGYFIAVIKK